VEDLMRESVPPADNWLRLNKENSIGEGLASLNVYKIAQYALPTAKLMSRDHNKHG